MGAKELTNLFRKCAKLVLEQGGVFRSCENYGLKRLPHRMTSRHASAGMEGRYNYFGRHVAMHYDCAPNAKPQLEFLLKQHVDVLRVTTLKPRTRMDKVNSKKTSNPWRPPVVALAKPLQEEDVEVPFERRQRMRIDLPFYK